MKDVDIFSKNGFAIIENIYTSNEVEDILKQIEEANSDKETFRKSSELFAIRQFLLEVPSSLELIFNCKLKNVLSQVFGKKYFVVKSIYFDKPPASNWYVAYHQDLTISVDKKIEISGFENFTKKQNLFAVQPPITFLENIVTVRIHLDDTDENNGALKVISKSHLNGVKRPENIDWNKEREVVCEVPCGGIMLMKPLLLHSSGRTINQKRRRVIHLEFSNQDLSDDLNWSERIDIN